MTNSRRLAFETICDVIDKGEYSNILLPRRLRDSSLDSRDRAFATELVYGTLRAQSKLDFIISKLSHRAIDELELRVLVVLRLGVFQLIELRTPPHAAINETTELAKQVLGKSTASFIHGILRNLERQEIQLPVDDDVDSLAIRFSLPGWIIRAFSDSLRDSASFLDLLSSQNIPARPVLNALPGRGSEPELIASGATKIEGSARAFTYDGNPGEIEAIRKHSAIVQDLGSQVVVEEFFSAAAHNLSPSPRWLDLCAGPGGKAAYLDSLITDGEFVANEISAIRARLVETVVRRGKVTNVDGRRLKSELGSFDRILLDAPCTGLGALRRRPEIRWRRSVSDLGPLQQLQRELLTSAADALNPGGLIGYATCSPHLIETKLQIRRFLAENPNFTRVSVSDKYADTDGDLQLWTHKNGTDSMFLSLLRKTA